MHRPNLRLRELYGPNVIFVFGSNEKGMHGAGAALWAKQKYGALSGRGEGGQGYAYGIPTKASPSERRSLTAIKKSIARFHEAVLAAGSEQPWFVTRVGAGLAGFSEKVMKGLFDQFDWPSNVHFSWFSDFYDYETKGASGENV